MGNCVFGGGSGSGGGGAGGGGHLVAERTVKVVTSNGGVMELYAPITAACITDEFPGYGLFQNPRPPSDSPPLLKGHQLRPGRNYYLLPLHDGAKRDDDSCRSTPYRMSAADASNSADKFSRSSSGNTAAVAGEVWKVRLVINPDQLSEILSHEAQTEALVESVRAVAKCSSAVVPPRTAEDHRRCKTWDYYS
ncbi:hypothetical protein M569_05585 [Genlisea aurea]|uniref:Uncharacterized protein n=1 Tax=Genlisea aurea TaxID=192259 RepID=S8E9L2_9LAMI|nr:hypothetical protein M569_05585 [Genlisea aurea]